MAPSSPIFHYYNNQTPQILGHGGTNSSNHNTPRSSSSSSSCSPSPYSSYPTSWDLRRGRFFNFINFSGTKNIWKHQSIRAQAMSTTRGNKPDHLLVLVHGIMGSPSDFTYFEAKSKRRLGKKFLIYASSCNAYRKSFAGIDVTGKRLADEVMEVVKKTESLRKISFLAHSLGGLVARYAVSVLYTPPNVSSRKGLIAGLEAINFIALGAPHLGLRGNKQLPFLFGVSFLEKIAALLAPILSRRSGSHLFLRDGEPNKPPLLVRMASDCEDGKFISALDTFRCRVLYANVSYDYIVGRRSSSIRREKELVKPTSQSLYGYEHIVHVEYCPPKEASQNEPTAKTSVEYHVIMEEEMVDGLQRLGWTKVDVNFQSAKWPYSAHNNLNVKTERVHGAGAGVVAHVADTIKQQEKQQKTL